MHLQILKSLKKENIRFTNNYTYLSLVGMTGSSMDQTNDILHFQPSFMNSSQEIDVFPDERKLRIIRYLRFI